MGSYDDKILHQIDQLAVEAHARGNLCSIRSQLTSRFTCTLTRHQASDRNARQVLPRLLGNRCICSEVQPTQNKLPGRSPRVYDILYQSQRH